MIITAISPKKGHFLGRFDGFVFQATVFAVMANVRRMFGQAIDMNRRIRTGASEYLASRLAFDVPM